MNAIIVTGLLILCASLPLIICFPPLRRKVGARGFMLFVCAGAASMFAAALVQQLLPAGSANRGGVFFSVFVRIALVEEAGRLLTLIPMQRRFFRDADDAKRATGGFVSGLGFAFFENVAYGTADPILALIRSFVTAPLHASCGARAALASSRDSFVKAAFWFAQAIIIHGVYDLLAVLPGLTLVAALFAYAVLGTTIALMLKSTAS